MNHIMAVCDEEESYAVKLVDYLNMKEGFPFEVRQFTSLDKIREFSGEQNIELALVSEYFLKPLKSQPGIEQLILLDGSGTMSGETPKSVYKYQSCESMIREVLQMVADTHSGKDIITRKTGMKLIGLYSPVKRSLQTTFAFTMGQLLAKKSKVLYVNLESFSGLGRMLQRDFCRDLSDILYYIQNGKSGLSYLLGSAVESVNGLDVLPPMLCQMDLVSITREEWLLFLKELEKYTEYEYLILDLSDSIQGLFEILRQCSRVYTITGNDGFAMAKADQYEKMLQQCRYEDVLGKTKKCDLPRFSSLPLQLERMGVSELAKTVRRYLQEDEDGAVE